MYESSPNQDNEQRNDREKLNFKRICMQKACLIEVYLSRRETGPRTYRLRFDGASDAMMLNKI